MATREKETIRPYFLERKGEAFKWQSNTNSSPASRGRRGTTEEAEMPTEILTDFHFHS